MNTLNDNLAHSFAAVVAVALTTLLGWSFLDSTHVARWVPADAVVQALPAQTVAGKSVQPA